MTYIIFICIGVCVYRFVLSTKKIIDVNKTYQNAKRNGKYIGYNYEHERDSLINAYLVLIAWVTALAYLMLYLVVNG